MTRVAGIIGYPVAHSISPAMQGAAFQALGLDARYERWDTPPRELESRVRSLASEGVLGANVTIPHKEAVLPFLHELDASAARVGAVNTVVNTAGRLRGHNTDGPGFLAALRNEAGFEPAGRTLLLLGAGGAARGIAFALAHAGATSLTIVNRTLARAQRLADDLTLAGGTAAAAASVTGGLASYACVVNCTPLGMHGGAHDAAPAVAVEQLAPDCLVADIVYNPEETPFLKRARQLGLPSLGGLPMLVYQGALAFELWTGRPGPVEAMTRAAREALAPGAAGRR